MRIRLVRKIIGEGQVIERETAKILLSNKIVHKRVIDNASGGEMLEFWYLKKLQED